MLNTFSKIYEKVIKNQLVSYFDRYLSPFTSTYRKNYSAQQLLIHLLEKWREKLDKNFIVGAVLMDLSKVFDCNPHDLIIAKLTAYGIEREALRLIYSSLKILECLQKTKTLKMTFFLDQSFGIGLK